MDYKFNTLALHAGIKTDETGSRGVPLHRTSAYLFKNTEHAANLFALKELGIYIPGFKIPPRMFWSSG